MRYDEGMQNNGPLEGAFHTANSFKQLQEFLKGFGSMIAIITRYQILNYYSF